MEWMANMSDQSGSLLVSTRPAKLAERVAEALKRDISAIGWPVGQVFGSEAQLMERYGIGRATLREAIRQLERHGVANMRRGSGSGSGGGLVISRPARDSAALALATYLELIDVSFGELYEARALIESQAVLLAAERLDEPDIPRARALIELLGQEQPGCFNAELRLLADVRDFICRVSGNAAISLILEALQCVTVSGRTPRDAHARARVQTVFGQVRRLKIELLEALIGGDGLRARERIQDKLRLTRELIIELRGGLSHGPTSAMTELAAAPDFAFSRVYDKSAHRLAVVIARNISASGLGSGAEPDLQARHGVSRAVLREAVRTLELHAIVRSRRGPGGGLLVATPDPSYTVRLAVEYLGQTQPLSQHFHAVWKNLQLAVAGLAAKRLDAAGRQRLQALLDSLQRAGEAERLQRSGELDLCLAELSGNRALALFVRLLGALAESYPSGAVAQWILQHLGEHQARLGAAVLAGDPSLARRRMLDQLRLIETGFGLAED